MSLEKIQYFLDSGRISSEGTITLQTLYKSGCVSRINYPGIKLTAVGKDYFKAKIDIEVPRASLPAISAIEKNGGTIRCIYYSKYAIRMLKKGYDLRQMIPSMGMPNPKLFRYYMREDIRGYLRTSQITDKDVVPEADAAKERERAKLRLMGFRAKLAQEAAGGKKQKKAAKQAKK